MNNESDKLSKASQLVFFLFFKEQEYKDAISVKAYRRIIEEYKRFAVLSAISALQSIPFDIRSASQIILLRRCLGCMSLKLHNEIISPFLMVFLWLLVGVDWVLFAALL